jgi:hypothetical protein
MGETDKALFKTDENLKRVYIKNKKVVKKANLSV